MRIGLLGPTTATRDGQLLALPAGKTTELLCRLAVSPGTPVRSDELIEDLWGEQVAKNTLQAKVSQLRTALEDRELVRGVGDAYVLDLAPDAVDAARAAALARSCAAAGAAGDAASALADAEQGLALYRGEPLLDAGGWADSYRTSLAELRWGLVEEAMAARVDLGGGSELVPELERLVEQAPLRERLWHCLLTALYRAGRQADALAAYGRVRAYLADELGIDPGPGLRALESDILRQTAPASAARPLAAPGNLPVPTGPLLGRDEVLAEVGTLLTTDRLVTVVGPAGVGKSRLAIGVGAAAAPPGGAWLVRLEAVDATTDLLALVGETLHVTGGASAVRQRLDGAPTLLVLDGCEHLAGPVAALARELLDGGARTRLLATSQVPLGLADETVLPLGPLAPADSVALFRLQARRHRREGALDGRDELVDDVCRALDGLPLAIELAAARIRSLPLEDIARRLDDRFALLHDPHHDRGDRRHALDAAIGWSYDLLFPDDQRGLCALACFASGATLPAAEHVMAALDVPSSVVLDTVGRLVDRSLVVLDETSSPARYRLLDSVRAFAAERLREAGAAEDGAAAHAGWYAGAAARCHDEVRTRAQPEWLAFVRAERADVDTALAWCAEHDPSTGARIALGLGWAWAVLGDGSAGAARLRAAVGPDQGAAARLEASLVASWLEASAGDLALAETDLARADVLAGEVGTPQGVADLAWYGAFLAIQQGRGADVRTRADDAARGYRGAGNEWGTAAALVVGAYGDLMVGDVVAAASHAGEALSLLEDSGDDWGQLHARGILGGVAEATGRLADAEAEFAGAADAALAMGFVGQAALHRASWARAVSRAGRPDARAAYERALADASAVADARLAASLRLHLAQLLRAEGQHRAARDLVRASSRFYADAGGGDLARLNAVLLASIDDDVATLQGLRDDAGLGSDVAAYVTATDALARIAAEAGDAATARTSLAAADEAAGATTIDFVERVDADTARRLLSAP